MSGPKGYQWQGSAAETATTIRMAARTDCGVVRAMNQDVAVVADWTRRADAATLSFDEAPLASAAVCAVVDGMGGHSAGEVAAWLTAHVLSRRLDTVIDAASADALAQSAHALVSEAGRGLGTPDMGAAFAGLVLRPSGYAVLNVGYCRAYRLADGYLGLLTIDDTAPRRADPRARC